MKIAEAIILIGGMLALPQYVSAAAKLPFPLNKSNVFSGKNITWTADNIWGDPYVWYGPQLKSEAGLDLTKSETWATSQGYEKILPGLQQKKPPWHIAVSSPLYLGDFVERGLITPLDEYFKDYAQDFGPKYWQKISSFFRENYVSYGGKTYALPLDQDILVLHYRPSFFNDANLQKKYKDQFKKPLAIPQTWQEYNDVARFFTECLRHTGVYGTQTAGIAPWVWAYWYTIAAAYGVRMFDAEMKPSIDNDAAERALNILVESQRWSQPGSGEFGGKQTFDNWQKGKIVMAIWYSDLSEYSSVPFRSSDAAIADIPGVRQDNGSIKRTALSAYNRVGYIPQNAPTEDKKAAFYALARISELGIGNKLICDSNSGTDSYINKSELDFKPCIVDSKESGSKPMFDSEDRARQHFSQIASNYKYLIAQPTWPGSTQLMYTLGNNIHKALIGQMTAREALQQTEREWEKIMLQLDLKKQKKFYINYLRLNPV